MGAGVLPIAIHNKKVYLLLGKEHDSNEWSDFGGGAENGESLYNTAIREGVEELNGFFGGETSLKNRLRDNGITTLNGKKMYYRSYLFEVEYDKHLPYYFNQNFKLMKKLIPDVVNESNGLFEKSEVRWFTLEDLKGIKLRRFFYLAIYPELVNFFSNYKV